MCGLCGIVRFDLPGGVTTHAHCVLGMLGALGHRGPDERGFQSSTNAILGATRLAIRGLDSGHQPLVDARTGVVAVCNGEIDNHRRLRDVLAAAGHRVEQQTDVAVIPGLYLEFGPAFVERLEGAFALALYDPARRFLMLARDRVGERPLFYAARDSVLVFATEIRALACDPLVDLAPDRHALAGYLRSGSFAAPASPLEDVRKVPPATWIEFDDRGVREHRYWRFPIVTVAKSAPDEDAFDRVFREAVRKQGDVDVPVGVFLSGGLDSSLVAATAKEVWPRRSLRAYTLRFGEQSYDESSYAEAVADRLGLEHTCVAVLPEHIPLWLAELVRETGEPLADPAWVPTAVLARRAAQDVKLALVGEGADEIFGGYPTYVGAWLASRYARLPGLVRRSLDAGVRSLPTSEKKVTVSFLLKRFVAAAILPGLRRHVAWTAAIPEPELERLLLDTAPPMALEAEGAELLDTLQRYDLEHSLAEGLLTKADRASMNSALELRAPFLDLDVLEFGARLRARDRVRRFETKRFLKRYALRRLPRSIVYRRKRGLSVPLSAWLRGPLHDWARERLASAELETVGLSTSAVLSYFDDHALRRSDHARGLSTLLALAEWCAWRHELETSRGSGAELDFELRPFVPRTGPAVTKPVTNVSRESRFEPARSTQRPILP